MRKVKSQLTERGKLFMTHTPGKGQISRLDVDESRFTVVIQISYTAIN